MKQHKCKFCGAIDSHWSFQCHTQRKPIKVNIVTKEWVKKNDELKKKRKKNISPIAEKEKKRLAEYRVVRDEWLGINNRCQFPNCYSRDVQLHHAAGRIGSLLVDTRYFRALCDTHHRWVELHPLEAKEMNLSVNRLDK